MNIDEERKAFEAVVLPTGLFTAVKWNGERYTMAGGRCMTQDYFEVWLKAKAHAEEMRKPFLTAMVEKGVIYAFEESYFCLFCDESNSEAEHILHSEGCAFVRAKNMLD